MDIRAEITRVIGDLQRIAEAGAGLEDAAFKKGWEAAFSYIMSAAKTPVQQSLPLPSTHGERSIIEVVHELVKTSPGLRGYAIVDAMVAGNPRKDRKSLDRTTRTALMRLKNRGAIDSRNGLWYPKEGA